MPSPNDIASADNSSDNSPPPDSNSTNYDNETKLNKTKHKETRQPEDASAHWQRTLWIIFVSQLTTAIGFSVFFPFLPLFVQELGSVWDIDINFLISLSFAAQSASMMIASPLWGTLADRVGRKPMVLRATLGGAALMILMAFSSSAEELVFWRCVQGAITGVVVANNALVASIVPRERSGYALGLMQTGLLSGIAIGPLLGGVLQDVLGMRATFLLTALLLFAAGIIVLFGVKENFVAQPVSKQSQGLGGIWQQWRKILQSQYMPTLFFLRFTYFFGRGLFVPYVPLIIQMLITDPSRSGTMTGLLFGLGAITGTISSILLGNWGDKIGHRQILFYSALLAGCCYFPQAWASSATELIVWNVVLGLAAGGVLPAVSALINHYTVGDNIGAAFGLDNAVASAARTLAFLLSASVVIIFGYHGIFIISGIAFLLVALVTIIQLPVGVTHSSSQPIPSP